MDLSPFSGETSAELVGDDVSEWDFDVTSCQTMTDAEIDCYIEEHAKKHYGGDAGPKRDGK